jgi:hypothetical protein
MVVIMQLAGHNITCIQLYYIRSLLKASIDLVNKEALPASPEANPNCEDL